MLFFVLAAYAVGYLRVENPRGGRLFVSCLLAFLAAASLVVLSHQMGLLWVGMEATTLAVAPLIFHRHDRRSLEAIWKYLVISSVGIALALLGMFFLATRAGRRRHDGRLLVLEDLVAQAPRADPAWLQGGVRLPAGRVRDQDGPGPDAHLEAGHLRRGAAARGRAHGGRAHELRVPRDRADRPGDDARRGWRRSCGRS